MGTTKFRIASLYYKDQMNYVKYMQPNECIKESNQLSTRSLNEETFRVKTFC